MWYTVIVGQSPVEGSTEDEGEAIEWRRRWSESGVGGEVLWIKATEQRIAW